MCQTPVAMSDGVHKFVLISLAEGDDDLMDQTRRLAEEVLPVVHAWA